MVLTLFRWMHFRMRTYSSSGHFDVFFHVMFGYWHTNDGVHTAVTNLQHFFILKLKKKIKQLKFD